MLVARAVVADRPLAGGVLDVPLGDRLALRARGVVRELEDLERAAGVAAGSFGDELGDLAGQLDLERGRAPADDLRQCVVVERFELEHACSATAAAQRPRRTGSLSSRRCSVTVPFSTVPQ